VAQMAEEASGSKFCSKFSYPQSPYTHSDLPNPSFHAHFLRFSEMHLNLTSSSLVMHTIQVRPIIVAQDQAWMSNLRYLRRGGGSKHEDGSAPGSTAEEAHGAHARFGSRKMVHSVPADHLYSLSPRHKSILDTASARAV
jgi:hypothetical protein